MGGSLIMALVLAEGGARLLVRAWPFDREIARPPHLTERDAALRWRFSPSEGRNSLGLKNREIGLKPATTTRILFLGDSLVWSGETTSGQLYTEIIEANLNDPAQSSRDPTVGRGFTPRPASLPGQRAVQTTTPDDETAASNRHTHRFEVINAGIPGYTTYQELEFLRAYGLQMDPDLVILAFVFNDVYFKYLHKPTSDSILDSEPSHHLHHFDPDAFPGSLVARSYFAHLLYFAGERVGRRALGRTTFPFQLRGDFYLAWKPHGWRHTPRLLASMQDVLHRHGAHMLAVTFPIRDQVTEAYLRVDRDYVLYPQRQIATNCRELDIPLVDLTPALMEGGGSELFRDSLHLTGTGNDLVAEVLTGYLVNGAGRSMIEKAVSR